MIVYELRCANDHRFEGWFGSAADFENQRVAKQLACPMCSSDEVERVPHTTYVTRGRSASADKQSPAIPAGGSKQYANVDPELIARLVDAIVANTEDVGAAFPEEARKIHYHEAPERHIRGTASPREVDALREEGIDVVAVPIPPHRVGKAH